MTDHTTPELTSYVVIATTGALVASTLPGPAVLVVLGVTVAVFVAARTLTPLLGVAARPDRVAARAAAAVLVLLGAPAIAAATLGPRSVPLLACVAAVLALACSVLARRGREPGQEPRNVDR